MSENDNLNCRMFTSYSGIALPLKLVNELTPEEQGNRNTFFKGYYDDEDKLVLCEQVVYGEIELTHRYSYHDNGKLKSAEITDTDDEPKTIAFDEQGKMVR